MSALLKIFFGFWAIWIIWYLTGGPLRDDKSKTFIGLNPSGQLESVSTSTLQNK